MKSLDLSALYKRIKAVERRAGQSAIDPRIPFALWLYATLRGIGSARELDRRCDSRQGEAPFQWICGGVSVNYRTLADFRTAHVELLDRTLTTSVAVLMQEGPVTLDRVAQDGMKALEQLPAVEVKKKPSEKEEARVSTTDPEARVMKMADGGYRPAYNVQLGCKERSVQIVSRPLTPAP